LFEYIGFFSELQKEIQQYEPDPAISY